jgi:DNA-directed RNA polymerase specialized sigma24 family protein
MKKHTYDWQMEDERVKALIRAHRAGDPAARNQLFTLLWSRVQAFPKRYGHFESKESALFFDHVLERLFPCIERYSERAIPFGVWFNRVLANAWSDSILRAKKMTEETGYDMDSFIDEARYTVSPSHTLTSLSPWITELLTVRETQLLFLRYPSLLHEESLPGFASIFGCGKRRQALIRLLVYARRRAAQNERILLDKLSALHTLHFRLREGAPGLVTDKRRALLERRRALLLERLYSSIGTLSYKTVAHIAGLPFGTVTCTIHRARCRIEQARQAKEEMLTIPESPRRSA